ncbi:hypothetical protein BC833DRAFT_583439 [Globomyces pollinis-pini]|nr:hypothetical protein BC833DRAFT_583439 [Globomyces pollinis-pini]KAJ3000767.1 hypothetical protein HDV02_003569 [Globomyces sp. JEL0801]
MENKQEKHHINNIDGDLMHAFKNAANSVALLYKESVTQGKKSFDAGYEQALQDMYGFLQTQINADSVSINELIQFLQLKQTEIHTESQNQFIHTSNSPKSPSSLYIAPFVSAPSIPVFNPSISDSMPLPENLQFAHPDSLKRRWGFNSTFNDAQKPMNLDLHYPEQPIKRSRHRSEKMVDE